MKKTIIWLWTLIRPYKWRAVFGAFLVAVTVLANIGLLATSSVLLAKAALLPPLLLLMPYITGVRFFGISRAVLRYAERLFNHSVAFHILGGLRVSLYNHLEPLVPDRLTNYTEGKMYQQLIKDIDVLRFFYLRVVSIPLGTLLVIFVSSLFVSLFIKEAGIALAGMLCFTACLVFVILWKRNNLYEKECRDARGRLANVFADMIHGIDELLGAPGRTARIDNFTSLIKQDLYTRQKIFKTENVVKRLIVFFSHLTMLLLLWICIPYVSDGRLDGIYLAMIGLIALASFETIQQFPQTILELQRSFQAAEDMVPIMSSRSTVVNTSDLLRNEYDLRLSHVTFCYHGAAQNALENVSMDIPEGARVAFVGTSGSGKSSAAKLLLKLWRTDEGTLYLGGQSYDTLSEDEVRQYVSLLEQEPSFFHATLRENLLLANAQANDAELWDVLKKVDMADKVKSFTKKLDEPLGENAMRLSGGERQRLALARIILKDAPVMILDEPLQNLDGITAAMLEELFQTLDKKKTVIIITHELKNLPVIDFIYLFKNGKIITSGTHEACLEKSEAYRALWALEQQRV